MNKKEINNLVKSYLRRNEQFENNHNIGMARSRESMIKKYVANRNRQLGTFITDALSLKDIIFDKETPCDNPRFSSGAVEYYVLEINQLENYFSFRTLVKRGEEPTNNHPNFLVLYLMEIVNGIYGIDYKSKRVKLDSLLNLYKKGAKYRNLIQEAYEILFLQNLNSLNKDDYIKEVNLPLFKDVTFKSSQLNSIIIPKEDIFKMVKFESYTAVNAKDSFILNDCFEYVYQNLLEDENFSMSSYDSIEEIFAFDYKTTYDTPINKLKAYFPITTNIEFVNKKGIEEIILDGIHVTCKPYYNDGKLYRINKILVYMINSIQHHCGDFPLPKQPKVDKSSYSYFASQYRNSPDVQEMIDKIIEKWVKENSYAKKGYFKSLEIMKALKERGDFKLDISDVNKVRKQSSEIQEKLIIDDGETPSIDIPKKSLNPFVEHSSHEDDSSEYFNKLKGAKIKPENKASQSLDDNEFTILIKALSKWEKSLLRALCDNNIELADDIASKNNEMLSLVVDRINTISNDTIEDVVIIDNEIVEDYLEELLQALK